MSTAPPCDPGDNLIEICNVKLWSLECYKCVAGFSKKMIKYNQKLFE